MTARPSPGKADRSVDDDSCILCAALHEPVVALCLLQATKLKLQHTATCTRELVCPQPHACLLTFGGLQGQLNWASPPRMLRLAVPYVVGVLGDSVQILSLQHTSADTMSQVRPCQAPVCTAQAKLRQMRAAAG